jgi:hypothetical protein
MKFRLAKCAALLLITFCALSSLWAGDAIPRIAWKRGIGAPCAARQPGTRKPALTDLTDDGYWQGAPVGGFGSGTWFRSPEAYEIDGTFRASMYMRPAAIWAMEMTEPPPTSGSPAGASAPK